MTGHTTDPVTLDAIAHHGWKVVLLRPHSKKPVGEHWIITSDLKVIGDHLAKGGNLGLVCGPDSNVAVLDFDDMTAAREMLRDVGPLPIMTLTGREKWHCYFRHEDELPSKIEWNGKLVGEVFSGEGQKQVVMPPSLHPITGVMYRWLGDPSAPLSGLPPEWRKLLLDSRPSWIPNGREGVPRDEPWNGPPVEWLIENVLKQPGVRRRRGGWKFQCPGCRAGGWDKPMDNAILFADGHWACAVDPTHKKDIAEVLNPPLRLPDRVPEPFQWVDDEGVVHVERRG